jgi:hypothetical protein
MDLRQGDILSCILFNITLEKAARDLRIATKGTKQSRYLHMQMTFSGENHRCAERRNYKLL